MKSCPDCGKGFETKNRGNPTFIRRGSLSDLLFHANIMISDATDSKNPKILSKLDRSMLAESKRLPEPAATPSRFGQNGWPTSSGISGRLHQQSAAGIERNMQVPIHLLRMFRSLVLHGNDSDPTEQVTLEAQFWGGLCTLQS